MARLSIANECKSALVSRGDGALLRRAIESHWSDSEQLVLDFADVRVASVSFFDESFGMLAKRHSIDELTKRIKVENIDPSDRALLNRIVLSRSRERSATSSG